MGVSHRTNTGPYYRAISIMVVTASWKGNMNVSLCFTRTTERLDSFSTWKNIHSPLNLIFFVLTMYVY